MKCPDCGSECVEVVKGVWWCPKCFDCPECVKAYIAATLKERAEA